MEKSPTNFESRVRALSNTDNLRGDSVIYVMSRDQRVQDNHALLAAQQKAIELKLPLAVCFVLYEVGAKRAREHYDFMLQGLNIVEQSLKSFDIPFIMLIGEPVHRLIAAFGHFRPAGVYFDFSPLQAPRNLQQKIAEIYPVYCVDTHNIVPAWQASNKQEVGARTLRPKIHKILDNYLIEPPKLTVHPYKWPDTGLLNIGQLKDRIEQELANLKYNGTLISQKSGEIAAHEHLENFISTKLPNYALNRNNPSNNCTSGLSPYLHFGQISSLRVMLEIQNSLVNNSALQPDADALLEEMVIRKELSDNFCYYNQNYLNLSGAPNWAQATLAKHANDPRQYLYSLKQLEAADTHDPAWNAAQRQLTTTGHMHGYMRMYWAKKVLEWSESAEIAMQTLIYLNDFYSLDGGDPNGYVGILWSVAGLHDRPWGERPIYGNVRSMVYGGLKRKFDIQKYVDYNNPSST